MCVPNCTLQVYWCCYTPHCKNTYLHVFLSVQCTVGTSDFDAQMSGIKISKGNEILRAVYKKTIFRNIEWLLPFWAF
jgi:hypothetical protein